MGKEERMGRRTGLKELCEIQFNTRDGDRRQHKVQSLNLSSNAIALKVGLDNDIIDDYGDLISGVAFLNHPVWSDDPEQKNWRRGFLSLAQRMNSTHWKWVFFFNRNFPYPKRINNPSSGRSLCRIVPGLIGFFELA
ncbi:MAG: hypothetical protein ABEH89_01300 [bacterium]